MQPSAPSYPAWPRCLSTIFQVPVHLHVRSASQSLRVIPPTNTITQKGSKCACTLPLNHHPPSSILAEHGRLQHCRITGGSSPSRPIAHPAYPSHPLCFSSRNKPDHIEQATFLTPPPGQIRVHNCGVWCIVELVDAFSECDAVLEATRTLLTRPTTATPQAQVRADDIPALQPSEK